MVLFQQLVFLILVFVFVVILVFVVIFCVVRSGLLEGIEISQELIEVSS